MCRLLGARGRPRAEFRHRIWPVWRRILGLSWPVTVEQFLRTTDVVVAGFFSPAAVAAVGLADIFARMPGRFGRGIGDAAIALSSQDTGSGAVANRDEAVSQALLVGFFYTRGRWMDRGTSMMYDRGCLVEPD